MFIGNCWISPETRARETFPECGWFRYDTLLKLRRDSLALGQWSLPVFCSVESAPARESGVGRDGVAGSTIDAWRDLGKHGGGVGRNRTTVLRLEQGYRVEAPASMGVRSPVECRQSRGPFDGNVL